MSKLSKLAKDKKRDKKLRIKEGSKKDKAMDRRLGIKD